MTGDRAEPVVLVVEDEPDVAEIYRLYLADSYDVHCVETGEEALAALDDGEVDVVLLDRMLPGLSGDEVLEAVRDRGHGCRVAMVSALSPGTDVVDMGFDGYVTKPPGRAELRETVERLVALGSLDEGLQEYYSLVARRSALEAEFSGDELSDLAAYGRLRRRIERQRRAVDASVDLASDADFVGAVREISDASADGGDGREDDTTE